MQNRRKIIAEAIKSQIITVDDDLINVLCAVLKKQKIGEGSVLVIASKVVAITQGRVVAIKNETEFEQLVKAEADQLIGGKQVTLTLKNHIFTPWAGIDRSNTQKGQAILWPDQSFKVAQEICKALKKQFKLKKLGVIISDSFCVPMRKGVSGMALGYAGFKGVEDQRGQKDLYGNTLRFTQESVADSIATLANLLMGQGKEQTPFVLIQNGPVTFTNKKISPQEPVMPQNECLYSPLYEKMIIPTARPPDGDDKLKI